MDQILSRGQTLHDAIYAALLTRAPGNSERPIRIYCNEEERSTESFAATVRQLESHGLKVAVFENHVNVYKNKPRFASAAEKQAWREAHCRRPIVG